jgi:hypothetical protein
MRDEKKSDEKKERDVDKAPVTDGGRRAHHLALLEYLKEKEKRVVCGAGRRWG